MEGSLKYIKEMVCMLVDVIKNFQSFSTSILVAKSISTNTSLNVVPTFILQQSQSTLISKYASNHIIHYIIIFDKEVETKKGQDYARTCVKKIGLDDKDLNSAILVLMKEIKKLVTTRRNNQLRCIQLGFYGMY